MKKLIFTFPILAVATLMSCYEDKGNYDYHDINEVSISGIESNYNIDADDSLIITPTVQGTLDSDTSHFTYSWQIGGTEVGVTHDLRMQMNMLPGYKYSRLVVTDKQNGVKTYHEFGVNVSSSTAGDLIMVLSKYQGRAELSYLRLDKPANWAVNYYQDRFDESLGTTPQQLCICYTPSARNTPFVNRYGRVMVLVDNVVHLIDKSTLMPDTVTPYLTKDAYLQLVSYPKPQIENYKSEFVCEGINLWRYTVYSAQQMNHFIEISAGRLFYAASLAPSIWTTSYYYNVASPYANGYFSPFGYWDDMSDTPHNNNMQAGFNLGDFIVFDKVNGRFATSSAYGSVKAIAEENVKAFPGYSMLWGSATNRPDNTSIAVLSNGNQCRLVLLNNGTNGKTLIGDISGGVAQASSSFYMMKYNDNLFFSSGNALYRYNIMDISSNMAPAERNKIMDLTQLGYDSQAVITGICVSRSERTMLVGVSRYGNDPQAEGADAKGDILYFDLDKGSGMLTYNDEKSSKGVCGIPVDIQIKYQTHYRNGEDTSGNMMDNI